MTLRVRPGSTGLGPPRQRGPQCRLQRRRLPDKAHICCGLIETDKTMPAKLVLRSGWNPGDFFALVDLFPRHDPLNVPGIVGMTRWGAPLTQTFSAKGSSDENRLAVEDLGGTAPLRFNTDPALADGYYQNVQIPDFQDLRTATFATVTVSNYQGFPIQATREFLFIKTGSWWHAISRSSRRASWPRPVRCGTRRTSARRWARPWANTFFTAPRASVSLHTPPQDLLVYFTPQPGCRLQVIDRTAADPRAGEKQVWDWMQANPQQFIETFQKLVPPQAPAPQGPPGPDWRLEDGTLFYSAPQMQKLLEYQARQLRDQLDQEYGPIKQRVVEQEIGERAKREAGTLVGQARQHWPMFGDLEPDIKQAMAADHAISLHDAYIRVLRERGLKLQEDRIRSEYGAQLQRKADASTTLPRTPSSTPTSRTSLETRDLVTMEFDRLAKVR